MKRIFKNAAVVLTIIAAIVACDTDVNTLGTDFLGIDPNNVIQSEVYPAVAFSSGLEAVQTNSFTSMPFGLYEDPTYGRSKYEFVTQLDIPIANPNFGVSAAIDSVVVNIPYYSTVLSVDGENRTYKLDSVYNPTVPTQLEIYENNYFLNSVNTADLSQNPVYYSDLGNTIDNNKGQLILRDPTFIPSSKEVRLTETDASNVITVGSRQVPAYRKKLDAAYWKNKIFDQQGTSNLQSLSQFRNYFRGLYFKVDDTNPIGNLVHFNFQGAAIIIYYKSQIVDVADSNMNGSTTDLVDLESTYQISFSGNSVGLITNDFKPAIMSGIQASGNQITGDSSLYLKGGSGAMTFVDLFGQDLNADGEADALTALIASNRVINDATLTFYVDQSQVVAGVSEPERIIIYDVENNVALGDFILNSSGVAVNSNTTHLGRLERETSGDLTTKGVKYTLRLTRHVSSILAGNTSNVRLGISVSQNVNLIGTSRIKNNNAANAVSVERTLLGSAISHEGTILHGTTSTDVAKRPEFKIFFTETN